MSAAPQPVTTGYISRRSLMEIVTVGQRLSSTDVMRWMRNASARLKNPRLTAGVLSSDVQSGRLGGGYSPGRVSAQAMDWRGKVRMARSTSS